MIPFKTGHPGSKKLRGRQTRGFRPAGTGKRHSARPTVGKTRVLIADLLRYKRLVVYKQGPKTPADHRLIKRIEKLSGGARAKAETI